MNRSDSAPTRCPWCLGHPLYVQYHDEEWGVPEHDDDRLFEKIILDGAQAGLSWLTILKKREGYRRAFDGFDAPSIARYSEKKIARLLAEPGIIRNRLKVNAAVTNAQAYLKLKGELGSFDQFLWQFVEGRTRRNLWKTPKQVPATTRESDAMSRALRERGFKFVGSTICYAFMQAVGMVNDHLVSCFRYRVCTEARQGAGPSSVKLLSTEEPPRPPKRSKLPLKEETMAGRELGPNRYFNRGSGMA